jgi:hypothetical protein
MDTQSTRDARGAGSGGNAMGLQEQPLPGEADRQCSIDSGSEAGMTK